MVAGETPAKRPLPEVQPDLADPPEREEVAQVVPPAEKRLGGAPASGRGTRAQALEIIFASATELDEGFRTSALGTPRYGKTYHLQEVAEEALTRGLVEVVFIHDTKRADVQYRGAVRRNVADLVARPLRPNEPPIVVFHPDPATAEKCTVEEIAALGLRHGRNGGSVLVLADELYKGLKGRQTWEGRSFAEALREGSSIRVSSAFTTQVPQSLPTEALDLTETTAVFMLQGRSLSYAIDTFRLPPEAADVIKNLQRGEFILVTNVGDWDGVIYGPK